MRVILGHRQSKEEEDKRDGRRDDGRPRVAHARVREVERRRRARADHAHGGASTRELWPGEPEDSRCTADATSLLYKLGPACAVSSAINAGMREPGRQASIRRTAVQFEGP